MIEPIDLYSYVSPDSSWSVGYISAEDTHCYVVCPCGEEFSAGEMVVKCPKCGRIYWTDFICYRMETRDQYDETIRMRREHKNE